MKTVLQINIYCKPWYLCLMALSDITLKHQDSDTDGTYQPLDITKLVILGLQDKPDGKHFPLVQVSPRQWKVEGSIEV